MCLMLATVAHVELLSVWVVRLTSIEGAAILASVVMPFLLKCTLLIWNAQLIRISVGQLWAGVQFISGEA